MWLIKDDDDKIVIITMHFRALELPSSSVGKDSTCNAGDSSSIPRSGSSAGEGISYTLQYSGLEISMACIVHGVTKSQTRLSDFHFFPCLGGW